MITQKPRYLLLSDFDLTLFDTTAPTKSGMTVAEAYTQACVDIFGGPVQNWREWVDGHRNDAPSEIAREIGRMFREGSDEESFLERTHAFLEHANAERGILGFLPELDNYKGRELGIPWNSSDPESTLAQLLTAQKLQYLLGEIGGPNSPNSEGNVWPPPVEGAERAMNTIRDLKEEGVPIDFGIISSGHDQFIRGTLYKWGLPQPDILVTEDRIRPKKFPLEAERRSKPGLLPLALAHHDWIKQQTDNQRDIVEEGRESRKRIMYVGDSLTKDMFMAQRGGIESRYLIPYTASWDVITDNLISKKSLMDGRPFSEVFSVQRSGEAMDGVRLETRENYRSAANMERR